MQVEQLGGEESLAAAARHAQLHFGGVGVDAPQASDLFYRLSVQQCFYVGGMGATCQAEVISAAEYQVLLAIDCHNSLAPGKQRSHHACAMPCYEACMSTGSILTGSHQWCPASSSYPLRKQDGRRYKGCVVRCLIRPRSPTRCATARRRWSRS